MNITNIVALSAVPRWCLGCSLLLGVLLACTEEQNKTGSLDDTSSDRLIDDQSTDEANPLADTSTDVIGEESEELQPAENNSEEPLPTPSTDPSDDNESEPENNPDPSADALTRSLLFRHTTLRTLGPSTIVLSFTLFDGNGDPLPDFAAEQFMVSENEKAVPITVAQQAIINNEGRFGLYTMLLLDMSGSLVQAANLAKLREAVSTFLDTTVTDQRVAIYLFDGRADLQRVSDFTSNRIALGQALNATLTDGYSIADQSTNLYGAIISGLELLNQHENGEILEKALVVLTDNTDQAGRRSQEDLTNALRQSEHPIFSIGLGNEVAEAELQRIGNDGKNYLKAVTIDNLAEVFDEVADRLHTITHSHYLLAYCSPKRNGSGNHEVTLTAHQGEARGSISQSFSADGFEGGCNPLTLADLDGDGFPNILELGYGSNLLDRNSGPPDLDGDTIIDEQDEDLDGDGQPNSFETNHGSDPSNGGSRVPDLDGDGLADEEDDDQDGDDVSDDQDNCPLQSSSFDADRDGCDDYGLTNSWIGISGGTFLMGNANGLGNERPAHRVTLSAYRILRYEVTAGEFRACIDAGGCSPATRENTRCTYDLEGKEGHPINCLTWSQARAYCQWLGGDLPTEAQWEYAARGNDGRSYPWGNLMETNRANFWDSFDPYDSMDLPYTQCGGPTTTVGYFDGSLHGTYRTLDGRSPFGLHDLIGNVREWVLDWYDTYPADAQTDPSGPSTGATRGMRGGSWHSERANVSSVSRVGGAPDTGYDDTGMRCTAPMR